MRKNRQTAKYHIKSYIIAGSLAGAISMALALPASVKIVHKVISVKFLCHGRRKREIYDEE